MKLSGVKEPGEYGVCVVGGGTAGVLAAIRAARLGAKTVIVERGNCFGVAAYHCLNSIKSIFDIDGRQVRETLKKGGSAL